MGRIGGNRRPLGGAVPDLEKVLEEFALGSSHEDFRGIAKH
ncbi:hypothetical protein ACT3HK_14080 [Thermolongibacillus altinsuensis]